MIDWARIAIDIYHKILGAYWAGMDPENTNLVMVLILEEEV